MRREFVLPPNLLKSQIEAFSDEVLSFLDDSTPGEIAFNFGNVDIIVSRSIMAIVRLAKTITLLGIRLEFSNIPSHMALPLSQYLEGIPNVEFKSAYQRMESKPKEDLLDLLTRNNENSITEKMLLNDPYEKQKELMELLTEIASHEETPYGTEPQSNEAVDYISILENINATSNRMAANPMENPEDEGDDESDV